MKTKINFAVESTEITKQITAAVTAEAISEARKIAKKQFDAALKIKIETLIKAIDDDVKPEFWRKSELRKAIVDTVQKTIVEVYKNNQETLKEFVKTFCAEQMRIMREAYMEDVRKVREKIKTQVEQEVETYMKDAVIQAIFDNRKFETSYETLKGLCLSHEKTWSED